MTIDLKNKFKYSFYIYDSDQSLLGSLSEGSRPFISNNIININDENMAFIDDRFTQFNLAHLYLDKMTRIPLFDAYNIDKYFLFGNNDYIEQLFKKIDKEYYKIDQHYDDVTYMIKNLYLTSGSFTDMKHPAQEMSERSIDYLKKISGAFSDAPDESFKKIFIDRSLTGTRNIENMSEVDTVLKKYNITKVLLENYPLEKQVQIFKSADLIVGIHGAGLANMIFAKEGSTIIEILPPLYGTPAFWKLAGGMGMKYNVVVGQDLESDTTHDRKTFRGNGAYYIHRNFILPVDKLEDTISRTILA